MSTTLEAVSPPAPAARAKARDTFFDNAKFLAIVLVVLGHVLAPLISSVDEARSLYLFVYIFHMPAFILVAGYFSQRFPDSADKVGKLAALAAPFVVFQVVYLGMHHLIGPDDLFDPGNGPDPNLFDPIFLTWFLLCLMIWRITSPFWRAVRWPIAIAVALSLFAGTQRLVDEFEMGRLLTLLPFFVIGMRLRPAHFEFVRRPWVRLCSAAFLATVGVTILLLDDRLPREWVLWRSSNADLGVDDLTGTVIRVGMLVLALAMVAAFLSLTPRRPFWFSKYGAVTLYVYLLHGVFSKTAEYLGWYELDWIRGRIGALICAVLAVGLALLLSTSPVRRATHLLVEPPVNWPFKPATQPSERDS